MEADIGFSCDPTSHAEPPAAHLPPEPRRQQKQQQRRDRSSESVGCLPTRNSTEYLTTDNNGGGGSLDRRNLRKKDAQASVQVRVNPDGKSVTVYRVPPEENERDRRKRAWLRGERGAQWETSPEPVVGGDAPWVGVQSSTIAGASGDLLGKKATPRTHGRPHQN